MDLRLRSRPATVGSRKNWMIAFAAVVVVAVASSDAAAAADSDAAAAVRWRRCRWRRPSTRRWPPLLQRRQLRPRQRQRRLQRPPPTDGSWNYLSTAPSSGRTWVCYSRAPGTTVGRGNRIEQNRTRELESASNWKKKNPIMLFIYCGNSILFHTYPPPSMTTSPFSFPPTRNKSQEDKHTHTHRHAHMESEKERKETTITTAPAARCVVVVVFISCYFFSSVQRFVILSLFVLLCRRSASGGGRGVAYKKGVIW